jgi:hypothetical protein
MPRPHESQKIPIKPSVFKRMACEGVVSLRWQRALTQRCRTALKDRFIIAPVTIAIGATPGSDESIFKSRQKFKKWFWFFV